MTSGAVIGGLRLYHQLGHGAVIQELAAAVT